MDQPLGQVGRPLRAITWRSLLAGTLAVVAVCGLTPLNDFVFSDTSLSMGYLPLAAVVVLFLLIVAINAPLHRFAPRHALSTGELGAVVLMTLVACALPNWGLMRFLVPMAVSPFHVGAGDEQFWRAFVALDLPGWLFAVDSVPAGRNDPAATWFYLRVPAGQHIPWRAWITPLAAWGVFVAAMLATLVSLARMVLHQWSVNERLPFPLVQVQLALIDPPAPGRSLNALFRSPVLWIGLGTVLGIHGLSILNAYLPRYFPTIPLSYDLVDVLSEEPWVYLRGRVKRAALSFTVIGVTYFIRSKVAFSLWGIYFLMNLVGVEYRRHHSELTGDMWADQHLGACLAFVGGIFWIGRQHWARILRNALGLGGDSTCRVSFWVALGGVAVMVAWLMVVGVQGWVAGLIVAFILASHLIVSRVVAETGLPIWRTSIAAAQIYRHCPVGWFGGRDIYFAGVFNALGPLTTRDGIMGHTLHGLGVCQGAGVDDRQRRGVGAAIGWALLLGCIVAAAATLCCHYSYPTPPAPDTPPQRNYFGAVRIPNRELAEPLKSFSQGRFEQTAHSSALHTSIGFGVTVVLQVASLRWANWPLLPVGYVTSYGAFIENTWFSIFVGWLAKVVIVRFGGASLFTRARPLFVGVIFGESLAAAGWLIVNAVLVMNGFESRAVRFLL